MGTPTALAVPGPLASNLAVTEHVKRMLAAPTMREGHETVLA